MVFSFTSANRAALERARVQVQRYLDSVLADDQLNQSEIVYAFLSPSPSHLKSGLQVTKPLIRCSKVLKPRYAHSENLVGYFIQKSIRMK